MYKVILIILMLVVVSVAVFGIEASNERFLISVDVSGNSNKELLEDINPPVYIITEEVIIAGYSELSRLGETGLRYKVIDKDAWSGHYYIVTNKRGDSIETAELPGEVLFNDGQLVLIKRASSLEVDTIISSPYHFVELYQQTLEYHYDTIITDRQPEMELTLRTRNPEVDDLLNDLNADSLRYFIENLQDFGTRFAYADNRQEVVAWIEGQFRRFGYDDVETDLFYLNNTDQSNVIATLQGTANPEQVVIIGGHHDSITMTDPYNNAPGADDNASGTAAALEIARAMKAVGFQPETTVRFITYAAEEVGLHGSRFYAQNARRQDMDIKLVINNDMIGHNLRSPGEWAVRLFGYTGAENFAHFSQQIFDEYTSLEPLLSISNSSSSDSYSFFQQGYPAVFFMERDFNPHYHTVNDLLIHLDLDYALEIVKASAAVTALINVVPDIPQDFSVQDAGSGDALLVSWSPVTTANIEHYKIEIGLTSGNYFDSFTTQDTTITIENLEEGTQYYIGLSSVGAYGYSSAVVEESGIPRLVPLKPEGLTAKPGSSEITLNWKHNNEADLDGYRLYRSTVSGELGSPVHEGLLDNNEYLDTDLSPGVWYYYTLTAVDDANNESEPSLQISSRLITLDQGVLIVADTTPGSGAFMRPDLQSITAYYDEILSSYSPDIYSLWDYGTIDIADIGAYSTVVWHKNDSGISPYKERTKEVLASYLDLGGNLLISTFFPSRVFAGHHSYPFKPQEGSFIYDYLKIEEINYNVAARFSGAKSEYLSYPELEVDPDRVPETTYHHLFQI